MARADRCGCGVSVLYPAGETEARCGCGRAHRWERTGSSTEEVAAIMACGAAGHEWRPELGRPVVMGAIQAEARCARCGTYRGPRS